MKKLFLFNACLLQLGILAADYNVPQKLPKLDGKLIGMEMSRDGSYAAYTSLISNPPRSKSHFCSLSYYTLTLAHTKNNDTSSLELISEPACLRFNRQATQLAVGLGTGGRHEGEEPTSGIIEFFKTKDEKLESQFSVKREEPFSKIEDLCFDPWGVYFLKTNTVLTHSDIFDTPMKICGNVACYDLERDKGQVIAKIPDYRVGRCIFSDDGRLCAAQATRMIKLWDLRERASRVKTLTLSADQTKDCFYFSPDNSTICSSTKPSAVGTACTINLLSIGEMKLTKEFDLIDDSTEWQVSRAGNEFKVDIPRVKTARACKKMIGDVKPAFACTNAAETVLLYREKEHEQLFLAKTS